MFNLATVKEFLEDADILLGPNGPQYGLIASLFFIFIVINILAGVLNEFGKDLYGMLKEKGGGKSDGSDLE